MTPSDDLFPRPGRLIDALVRDHLERRASAVDADRLLARTRRRPTRRWVIGLPAALAAGLLLALMAIQPPGQLQASPAAVVSRARLEHAAPVDRCYQLQVELTPSARKRWPWLVASRQEEIWTRGDRFRVTPGPLGKGVWGRDGGGRVWLALGRQAGVLWEADEIPRPLAEFISLRSMDLSVLLDDVLRNCQLRRVAGTADLPAELDRIEAVPQGKSHPTRAVLDIDRDRHLVRRLVLERRLFGEEVAIVTAHLQQMRPRPGSIYELESELDMGAVVHTRSRPLARLRFMVRQHLGELLETIH